MRTSKFTPEQMVHIVRQGDSGTHPVRYRLYDRLLRADAEPAPADRVRRRLFYSYSPADEKLRERLDPDTPQQAGLANAVLPLDRTPRTGLDDPKNERGRTRRLRRARCCRTHAT